MMQIKKISLEQEAQLMADYLKAEHQTLASHALKQTKQNYELAQKNALLSYQNDELLMQFRSLEGKLRALNEIVQRL